MKPFIEVSLEVKDIEEGTGKYEGTLGALVCEGTDTGKFIKVNVGEVTSFSKFRPERIPLTNVVLPAARLPSNAIMSPNSMNLEKDFPNSIVSSAEDVVPPFQPFFTILFLSKYLRELSFHPLRYPYGAKWLVNFNYQPLLGIQQKREREKTAYRHPRCIDCR